MKGQIVWNIKELVEILKDRQKNKFDGNMAVTGDRGNGKSTLIGKTYYRFDCFNPWIHQVYNRKDVIKLLKTQVMGLCWDDEAIKSSYKRKFFDKEQQELIEILTAYRDNFNIFASAIPNFFSLDKDLRDLYFIHLHVIERGIAVVHMPIQGRLYGQDRWDAKYNSKIEENWGKRMKKNPDFKPQYHRLTTFRGYLYFNDFTEKQRKLYELIKKTKRAESFQSETDKEIQEEKTVTQKVYDLLIQGKLTRDGLIQICLINNKRYSTMVGWLNKLLTDNGEVKRVGGLLRPSNSNLINNSSKNEINKIVPDLN